MTRRHTCVAFCLLLSAIALSIPTSAISQQDDDEAAEAEEEHTHVLRHVVMFRFKPEATPEQITSIEEAFAELSEKIDSIEDYEWGTNNSPEGLNDGFTHCFLVTFADEAGREKYLPHPDHQAFVQQLLPILDKAFVLDYWAH
jgi:hypothetical protein